MQQEELYTQPHKCASITIYSCIESMHQMFLEQSWQRSTIAGKGENHITYIKPGYDLDFFDIELCENNKAIVRIPMSGNTYKVVFYDYMEAIDYMKKQFYTFEYKYK